MKNNQGVLKKLENLLLPESTILVELQKKISDNDNILVKKEDSISKKEEKIKKIEEEITSLNEENDCLIATFTALKDKDLKLITDVLKLSIDVKKDFDKLINQLPLQIEIRKNDINDLKSAISEEESKLEAAKNNIKNLEVSLEDAYTKQNSLKELIKETVTAGCMRTRTEVINILKGVNFSDNEAYETAKLIMFPEDELIPYFKEFKFEDQPSDSSDETYVDLDNIVETLKNITIDDTKEKENNKDEPKETNDFLNSFEQDLSGDNSKENIEASALQDSNEKEKKEELEEQELQDRLEDDTPISFEELKSLLTSDLDDQPSVEKETNVSKIEEEPAVISLEELQNQIEENVKEPVSKNDLEEVKTESKEILEDNGNEEVDFVKEPLLKLGKRENDIDLIKPFDTQIIDFDHFEKILKTRKIDTANLSLVVYKNGLQNYLNNLDALYEYGYKPSNMEILKSGNVLSYIKNTDLRKNLKTLKDYKIDLKMPSGHLAFNVLAVEPVKLVDKIDMLIENKQSDLITYDVNALSLDINTILKRITFCIDYNIPYTEEKNNVLIYNSYVFNQKILENLVEKQVELGDDYKRITGELNELVNNDILMLLKNNLSNDKEIKLTDAEKFDEFTRLEQKLESICVCKGNVYIIKGKSFSKENTKRNLITLINNIKEKNDKDLLIASLFYNSYKTLDDLKVVLESL